MNTMITPIGNSSNAAAAVLSSAANVLVVGEDPSFLALARSLRDCCGYAVTAARSAQEAQERLSEQQFDVLITDLHLRRMRGDDLQRDARRRDPFLATLLVVEPGETGCAARAMEEGLFDYLTKPLHAANAEVRVRRAVERRQLLIDNYAYRTTFEQRVADQTTRLRKTVQGSLETLIHAVEAKVPARQNHSARVADLAAVLAMRLSPDGDRTFIARVQVAALFHDIGKIGISETALHKTGKLTKKERAEIQRHPELGATILSALLDAETVAMVRSHHERVDGTGYPDSLREKEIPLGARIIAVANAYDAMNAGRLYRADQTQRDVLETLRDGAGTQWDTEVVDALLEIAAVGLLGEQHVTSQSVVAAVAMAADMENPLVESPEVLYPSGPALRQQIRSVPQDSGGMRPRVRPILYAKGCVDSDAIHAIRTEFEALLRQGKSECLVDMCESDMITLSSAQCIYALDLQARRAGGRLTLRDVPDTVYSQFADAGLARMLRFEYSPQV